MTLQGRKTLTGALKGVSYEDYESLKQTALRVDTVEAEKNKAVKRARAERDKEKARADAAEEKAAKAEKRAKEALSEKPPMKMQIENVELRHRLENIERWLKKLLRFIPEHFKVVINKILRNEDPFPQEQRREQSQDHGMGGVEM